MVVDKGCRACQSSSSSPGRATCQFSSPCKRGRALWKPSCSEVRPLLKSSPPASHMHVPLPGGPGETPGTSRGSVGKINACEPQGSRKWLPSFSSKGSHMLHDLSFSSSAGLPLRLSPFLPIFPISPPFSYFSPFPHLSPFSPGSCGLVTVHPEHVLPRQVLPSSPRSSGRVALSCAQLLQQPSQALPEPDPSCRIILFHAHSVGLKTV